jgi:hypothetical protein
MTIVLLILFENINEVFGISEMIQTELVFDKNQRNSEMQMIEIREVDQ